MSVIKNSSAINCVALVLKNLEFKLALMMQLSVGFLMVGICREMESAGQWKVLFLLIVNVLMIHDRVHPE